MTNTLAVKGIVPGDFYGVSLPSTADLQSKFASKIAELKAKRQERAEARQVAKDEKIYSKIRTELIEKVFNLSTKEIEHFTKSLAKFEKDINKDLSDKDVVSDSVNVANGSLGAEKSANRTFNMFLIGGASSLVGAGLTVTIGKSINDLMTAGVTAMFASIGAGAAALLVTGVQFAIKIAYNWYYKHKAAPGNRSDTKEKERAAIEKIKELFSKIERFTNEIKNDEQMLVEKRKSMSKKEFSAFLDKYLESKIDVIKEIGINDYLRKLGMEIGSQVESQAKPDDKKPSEQTTKTEQIEEPESKGASL